MGDGEASGQGVLELSIWGLDAAGKAFSSTVRARALSPTRALLEGVPCSLTVGETIGVRHEGKKARFRVTWVGQSGTAEQGQVRVENLEPDKQLWKVGIAALPERPAAGPAPAARCTAATASKRSSRRYPRCRCSGGAKIRSGASAASWAALKDLGVGGCYLETASTFPANTRVNLQISTEGLQLQAVGMVKASHPGYGMGIAFVGLAEEAKKSLESWSAGHSAQ